MTINLEQIENTIRTYKQALKNNPLTEKEKEECTYRIRDLELMREKLLKKDDN